MSVIFHAGLQLRLINSLSGCHFRWLQLRLIYHCTILVLMKHYLINTFDTFTNTDVHFLQVSIYSSFIMADNNNNINVNADNQGGGPGGGNNNANNNANNNNNVNMQGGGAAGGGGAGGAQAQVGGGGQNIGAGRGGGVFGDKF
jgi:hypothetical protein